jgi:hypothetical protein
MTMKLRSSTFEHPGLPGKPSQDRLSILALEDDGLLCVLSDGVGWSAIRSYFAGPASGSCWHLPCS